MLHQGQVLHQLLLLLLVVTVACICGRKRVSTTQTAAA
jgi:hypothetical protein